MNDCFADPYEFYGLEGPDFFSQVAIFMTIVVIPAAIGYMLWRIFVTNRARPIGTNVLGLNENSATHSQLSGHGIPWRTLFLYGLTGLTFAFEVFRHVVDLL